MGLTTAAFAAAQTEGGAMGTESGTGSTSGSTSGTMSHDSSMAKKPATKHHKAKAAKSHSARGSVTAVDATAKTMTVKAKSGDMSFSWDDKTIISPKGKTAADITVGTDVTVAYKTSGDTKMATKVTIHAPKAAPAAATPPTQ
jgi:hypothetical protein